MGLLFVLQKEIFGKPSPHSEILTEEQALLMVTVSSGSGCTGRRHWERLRCEAEVQPTLSTPHRSVLQSPEGNEHAQREEAFSNTSVQE